MRAPPSRPRSPPSAGWLIDLAENDVDHAIEDVLLITHVVVERHRLHAELLAELAHAQGFDAVSIGEADGSFKDALPGQWRARRHSPLPAPFQPSSPGSQFDF